MMFNKQDHSLNLIQYAYRYSHSVFIYEIHSFMVKLIQDQILRNYSPSHGMED